MIGMSIYSRPQQLLNTFLLHMRCTRTLPSTSCTFLQRTPCTGLLQVQSSPRCRCSSSKLSSPQSRRSLLDNVGMSIYLWPRQLLNTFLLHMRCTRTKPSTSCTFLERTPRIGLLQAPSSPRCRCSSSKLSSPQARRSLLDNVGMSIYSRPQQLLNTFLLHMRCNRTLPSTSCTFLQRTLCTGLQQTHSSPRCRCSSSKLSSPQ